ncbi:hypothetical protein OY671_005229 [Metschnikowia pulcherrima]|nr:hypothetical protein OY671_005229 [Metschnikowia pulcherrima]
MLYALESKASKGVADCLREYMKYYGVPEIIQSDNGTEFKGEVSRLMQEKRIKVVHSQAYSPQTNGSVEKGNGIAKAKIASWKEATGRNDWANALDEIALAMNLSPCRPHPRGLTPYIVFFQYRAKYPVAHFDRSRTTDANGVNELVTLNSEESEVTEEPIDADQEIRVTVSLVSQEKASNQLLITAATNNSSESEGDFDVELGESAGMKDRSYLIGSEIIVNVSNDVNLVEVNDNEEVRDVIPISSGVSLSGANNDSNSTIDESFDDSIRDTSDESTNGSREAINAATDDTTYPLSFYSDPPSMSDHQYLLDYHANWRAALVKARERSRKFHVFEVDEFCTLSLPKDVRSNTDIPRVAAKIMEARKRGHEMAYYVLTEYGFLDRPVRTNVLNKVKPELRKDEFQQWEQDSIV